MDIAINTIKEICRNFILGEFGYAHHELGHLTTLLLKNKQLLAKKPGIIKVLTKIVHAQENHDYLYIADLLGYELMPFLVPHIH